MTTTDTMRFPTTAEIRQVIKSAGYMAKQVSVRDNGAYWHVTIKDGGVSEIAVQALLRKNELAYFCSLKKSSTAVLPPCEALEKEITAAIDVLAAPDRTTACVPVVHDGVRFLVSDGNIQIAPSMPRKMFMPGFFVKRQVQLADCDSKQAAVYAAAKVQEIALDYNAI